MVNRNKKPLWQRIDEKFGFYHDERTERIQLTGVRYSFILAAILFPLVALYEFILSGERGLLWVTLSAVFLALIYLAARRLQLAGTAPIDERVEQLLNRTYRHAYLFLLLALSGFAWYILINAAPGARETVYQSAFLWPLTTIVTLVPLFGIHIRRRSYNPRSWWLFSIITLLVFLIAYLIGFYASQ